MKLIKRLKGIAIAAMCVLNVFIGIDISLFDDTFTVLAEAEEVVPEGYTPIYNIEELYAVRNSLGGKYILMNDIDMTEDTAPGGDWDINETGWEPIGTHNIPFSGKFDGNGHAIIGMDIHGDVQYQNVGLFSGLKSGEIKNLKMLDVNINISSTKHEAGLQGLDAGTVGSICGAIQQEGKLSNCFATGEIFVSNVENAGGIVGAAGYTYGGELNYPTISNCYNAVNISSDRSTIIGGIIGEGYYLFYATSSSSPVNVLCCYNIGNLEGQNKAAINNSIDEYGREHIYGDIKNCYYLLGSCEGQQSTSGVCQSLSEVRMKSQASYTNWDFENTWIIIKESSYQYPQLRSCMQVPVTEIEITSMPDKTVYYSGDAIDLTGGKILVKFEDGLSCELDMEENMLGTYNMSKVGKQTISVNFTNKTVSFDIEVNKKVYGDANLDGKLTIEDADYIISMIVQGKASELPACADYNDDAYINPSDAYLICCDLNDTTPRTSNGKVVLELNYMGGYHGEEAPVMVFSTGNEFCAFDFTVCVDPQFEISRSNLEPSVVTNIDKNITCYSYVNGNKIRFTGYANKGTIGGNNDIINVVSFLVPIPENTEIGQYETWFDTEVDSYIGSSNDNTENFYIKSGILEVAGQGILGDANSDGKVSIADARFIAKMLAGRNGNEIPQWADFNGDGKVNIKDARDIARSLASRPR